MCIERLTLKIITWLEILMQWFGWFHFTNNFTEIPHDTVIIVRYVLVRYISLHSELVQRVLWEWTLLKYTLINLTPLFWLLFVFEFCSEWPGSSIFNLYFSEMSLYHVLKQTSLVLPSILYFVELATTRSVRRGEMIFRWLQLLLIMI
jgi:hypothetical protein